MVKSIVEEAEYDVRSSDGNGHICQLLSVSSGSCAFSPFVPFTCVPGSFSVEWPLLRNGAGSVTSQSSKRSLFCGTLG